MAPLLLIGLGHGVFVADRDNGTARLVLAPGGEPGRLLLARPLPRLALVVVSMLLALGRFDLADSLTLRGGIFRSLFDDRRSFSNLLVDLEPDGAANQLILADPPIKLASTSGELRLMRGLAEGPRRRLIRASLRARDRRFDGSEFIDIGPTTIATCRTDETR